MSTSNRKKRYIYRGKVSKLSYAISLALLIWVILDYGKILMFFTSLCIVLLIIEIILHFFKKYIKPTLKAYSYKKELEKTENKCKIFEILVLFQRYLVIDYNLKKEIPFVKEKLKEILSSKSYSKSDVQKVDEVLSFYEEIELKEDFSDIYELMATEIEKQIDYSLSAGNYKLVFDLYEDMVLIGEKNSSIITKVNEVKGKIKQEIRHEIEENYLPNRVFEIYNEVSRRYKENPSYSFIDVGDFSMLLLEKSFEFIQKNTLDVYQLKKMYKELVQVNLLTEELHNEIMDKLLHMVKNSNLSNYLFYYDDIKGFSKETDKGLHNKLLSIIEDSNEADFENLYHIHRRVVFSDDTRNKLEDKINSIIATKTIDYPYGDSKCYAEFQVRILNKRVSEGVVYYDVENGVRSTFYIMENIIEIHNLHGIKKMNIKNIVKIEESLYSYSIPTILFPSTGGTMNVQFEDDTQEWYFIQLINMLKRK